MEHRVDRHYRQQYRYRICGTNERS